MSSSSDERRVKSEEHRDHRMLACVDRSSLVAPRSSLLALRSSL
jgi:hypothetical protein